VKPAAFNRRMRKTARPVVWEGDGAQSPSLNPIPEVCITNLLILCTTERISRQLAAGR